MPSYIPPKKNTAFVFYCGLSEALNPSVIKVNPTLAAGDVIVEVDGVSLGNMTALPAVTPAGSSSVRVALTADEMNGDNIVVKFVDQTAPKEWADLLVTIQTAAQQIDDLSLAATALSTTQWTNARAAKLDYLDAAVSSRDTLGSGAITWAYTLTSTVGGTPIADADVWVTTDLTGSNIIASGKTNVNGVVTFCLDAGTVYVWRQKSGWNFSNPDTEVVS